MYSTLPSKNASIIKNSIKRSYVKIKGNLIKNIRSEKFTQYVFFSCSTNILCKRCFLTENILNSLMMINCNHDVLVHKMTNMLFFSLFAIWLKLIDLDKLCSEIFISFFFIVMCNVNRYFNKVIAIKLHNFVNIRNNIITLYSLKMFYCTNIQWITPHINSSSNWMKAKKNKHKNIAVSSMQLQKVECIG